MAPLKSSASTTPTSFDLPRVLGKASTFLKDHLIKAIVGVVVLGVLFPEPGLALKGLKLFGIPGTPWVYDFPNLALSLLVLSASVHCDISDFKHLLHRPRASLASFLVLYVFGPLVAVLGAYAATAMFESQVKDQIRLGLIFMAVMPVGPTAAVWVRMTRGNVPLLLAVITFTTALTVLSVPFILGLLPGMSAGDVRLPMTEFIKVVVVTITIPVIVGIALRTLARAVVQRWTPLFALLGSLGLLFAQEMNASGASSHLNSEGLLLLTGAVVVVALIFFFFWTAAGTARALNLTHEDGNTLLFSSAMRNPSAAILLGLSSFPGMPLVTVPAAIYSISQQVIAGYVARGLRSSRGGILRSVVGEDGETLRGRLDAEYFGTRPARSPGFALIVFRIPEAALAKTRGGLSAAAETLRNTARLRDLVHLLPPNGLAVVVVGSSEEAAHEAANSLGAVLQRAVPEPGIEWFISHSNGAANAAQLFENAERRIRRATAA